ncbi:MAG: hypothetical protein JNK35_09845 [Phycisphaerae bacterium]|nr:hypothetical protein [Phycisphaerae bacterium]
MRTSVALSVAAAVFAGAAAAHAQQVIAYWRFPTAVPPSNTNFQITFPITADAQFNPGPATITTDATVWDGTPSPPALGQGAFQYFTGSDINAQDGDLAGSGLGIRNLTGNLTEDKSITFRFDTTGFQDIIMSYAERTTSTGPTQLLISVSGNGIDFTPAETLTTTRDATFRLRTVDLSAFADLNNNAAAYVRLTLDNITGSSGALRIDNVTFIPAPGAAAALALFGLAASRRRRA